MATPGELVKVIAEVLGVPEPTVVVHDRNLVIAGLRTKGGRGRSAASVTTADGTNVLFATLLHCVGYPMKDIAKAVTLCRTLKFFDYMHGSSEDIPDDLSSLADINHFGDAVDHIIKLSAGGTLFGRKQYDNPTANSLEIIIDRFRRTDAYISIRFPGKTVSLSYFEDKEIDGITDDLRTRVAVSEDTINAIGELIRDRNVRSKK